MNNTNVRAELRVEGEQQRIREITLALDMIPSLWKKTEGCDSDCRGLRKNSGNSDKMKDTVMEVLVRCSARYDIHLQMNLTISMKEEPELILIHKPYLHLVPQEEKRTEGQTYLN